MEWCGNDKSFELILPKTLVIKHTSTPVAVT
jgi:hypothetical protein